MDRRKRRNPNPLAWTRYKGIYASMLSAEAPEIPHALDTPAVRLGSKFSSHSSQRFSILFFKYL
jgi:hypothetical protein